MPQQAKTGNPSGTENSEDSKKDDVELTFSVFFDGTNNSKANIDERKAFKGNYKAEKYYQENESYVNEYSNVARLYCASKAADTDDCHSIYVEGIGTADRPLEETYTEFCRREFVDDTLIGSALGIGRFGVNAKVEKGCREIWKLTNSDNYQGKKVSIKLRVFGFSRGAAAARRFSTCIELNNKTVMNKIKPFGIKANAMVGYDEYNKGSYDSNVENLSNKVKKVKGDGLSLKGVTNTITSPKNISTLWNDLGEIKEEVKSIVKDANKKFKQLYEAEKEKKVCLLEYLKEKNNAAIEYDKINVDFLGLFDTVSSFGGDFYENVDELVLNFDNAKISKVFQLCAADEYRSNFALTAIKSAHAKGAYRIIPGAHSDIGGGYEVVKEEYLNWTWYNDKGENRFEKVPLKNGYKMAKTLFDEGWFDASDTDPRGGFKREVSNLYSLIPFNIMMKKAKEDCSGIRFDDKVTKMYRFPIPASGKKIDGYEHKPKPSIGNFSHLNQMYNLLVGENAILYDFEDTFTGGISSVPLSKLKGNIDLVKKIRHDYLHLSAKVNGVQDIVVNRPVFFSLPTILNLNRRWVIDDTLLSNKDWWKHKADIALDEAKSIGKKVVESASDVAGVVYEGIGDGIKTISQIIPDGLFGGGNSTMDNSDSKHVNGNNGADTKHNSSDKNGGIFGGGKFGGGGAGGSF